MTTKSPKILLLGDYSNCHNTLAKGLKHLGCDVTVVSDGSRWINCDRDFDISRKPGKLGGIQHFLNLRFGKIARILSGNDIVAIHDLNFVQLRPDRLRYIFDRLVKNNRSVFLTAMSTDIAFLDMLEDPASPLAYSEWFVDGRKSRLFESHPEMWEEWHAKPLVDFQRHALSKIDGAVSVLYEYQLGIEKALGADKTAYGGIPIDTDCFTPVELPDKIKKVKLFLGRDRNRKLVKGSDYLETAARRVVEKHPGKAELTIVENKTFDEFTELMKNSHVVLDQIYSYTPATTALMAMSYGLNVVTGGEPDYYDFIGEHDNRPIINAPLQVEALTDVIERIVLNPDEIRQRGHRSRQFVVKHNDSRVVARRFLEFWTKKLNEKK